MMLTLMLLLVKLTVFAQNNTSNTSGNFAQAIQVNNDNHRIDSNIYTQSFDRFVFDKAYVSCAFCKQHLGYVSQDQRQLSGFKIHSHSLLLQNGVYNCAKCNQPLFSSKKLNPGMFAEIDWLSFSAPISQDKITLNMVKVSALPYCANCSNLYSKYKDETGRFGVTFDLN